MSLLAEHTLYVLARLLYRTDVVHDAEMKQVQQSLKAHNTYRSQQVNRVLAAAQRFQLRSLETSWTWDAMTAR